MWISTSMSVAFLLMLWQLIRMHLKFDLLVVLCPLLFLPFFDDWEFLVLIWLTLSRGCGYGSPHSSYNMVQLECLTAHCPILWECYLHAIFGQLLSLLYTTQGTCDAKTVVLSTVWKYTL